MGKHEDARELVWSKGNLKRGDIRGEGQGNK